MERKTLKDMRLQRGMSQASLADALGINIGTLVNYERGETFPTVPAIYSIERVFGVPFCDIDFLC